jgi:hypothetical protein
MVTKAERTLAKLLDTIFEDGIVEPRERRTLRAFTDESELNTEQILSVFGRFVDTKWGEAVADGVITAQEKNLLATIVKELRLPTESLPKQIRLALRTG